MDYRHPVDMLLSGYLYHKSCAEPQWSDTPARINDHLPHNFPVKGSYCKFLQKNDTETGMRMELLRTMTAADGIGKMLKDIVFMQDYDVFNICLSDYTDKVPLISATLSPFGRNGFVSLDQIGTEESHHTDKEEQRKLFGLAQTLIMETIPVEVLSMFPCATEFTLTDSTRAAEYIDEILLPKVTESK